MLLIRPEQLRIFGDFQQERFELWMILHLRKFFPARCQSLGDSRLREFIGYGMKRAARHGFIASRDICKYVDLMMAFGRDFDQDTRLPWAGEILKKRRAPEGKMALLFRTGICNLR
jgi:hypothetical protein